MATESASVNQIHDLREVFAKFHPITQTTVDAKGNEDTEQVITVRFPVSLAAHLRSIFRLKIDFFSCRPTSSAS